VEGEEFNVLFRMRITHLQLGQEERFQNLDARPGMVLSLYQLLDLLVPLELRLLYNLDIKQTSQLLQLHLCFKVLLN